MDPYNKFSLSPLRTRQTHSYSFANKPNRGSRNLYKAEMESYITSHYIIDH